MDRKEDKKGLYLIGWSAVTYRSQPYLRNRRTYQNKDGVHDLRVSYPRGWRRPVMGKLF